MGYKKIQSNLVLLSDQLGTTAMETYEARKALILLIKCEFDGTLNTNQNG